MSEAKNGQLRPPRFYLVTGLGHCGTAWLSGVLHRPADRMVCYHEQKVHLFPGGWEAALKHQHEHGIDDAFNPYYSFMEEQLAKNDVVGDSGSWPYGYVPQLSQRLPVDLVIHLVRNGIQNVHSQFQHSEGIERNHWTYDRLIRRAWERAGRPWGNWENYTAWEGRCLMWSRNVTILEHIEKGPYHPRFLVRRFEDLLGNVDMLEHLVRTVNPGCTITREELASLQQTDVNRKIRGDRSPHALWNSWSPEQRDSFRQICGSAMSYFGYKIPSSVEAREYSEAAIADSVTGQAGADQ